MIARTEVPRKERIIAQSAARETSSPVVTPPPLPPGCVKGRASSRQQASPSQWPTSCSTQNLCAREKAAVYLSRNKDSDSEWSEGNVASTSFLPGCVLVMPDEGDLLEFHRQAEIIAGHFPAPAASVPAAPLAARPVPPFVTKLDSETVQCCSLLMPYCNRTDDENCVQNRQSC